jgi:nucleoid-associated protein YgaU
VRQVENRRQTGWFCADTKTMMDPVVKTAMALCVLLAGVCAAMLFRHDPPVATSPAPPAPARLLIHSDGDAAAPADLPPRTPSAIQRPATVVKPLDVVKSPAPLAPNYPRTDLPSDSRRGGSIDMMMPASDTRTHKIVDGDTLASLAQRYLGSATRAREIFDANRNVLSDPELLPIGAELKMPPTDTRQSPP